MDKRNQNISYYDKNAKEYALRTSKFDMSAIRKEFLSLIPVGGNILDAGCGPGWDSLSFLESGFKVEAFDASPQMVKIAKEKTGISVRELFFQEMDFEYNFDGIWANASLLHLELDELLPVLRKISSCLKSDGHFFASFKYGHGKMLEGGRWFTMMNETELIRIIKSISEFNIVRIWKSDDIGKRKNIVWLNVILRKN